MKPVRTKTTNRTFTGKGSEPLPATAVQFADGKIATEACFELTDEEIQEITKSKKIFIVFAGERIIPFMLNTKTINSGGGESEDSQSGIIL